MTLNCAIVDDEPLALDLMESYVARTPFLKLAGKYSSAVQAMKELGYTEVNDENVAEILYKIDEIQARKARNN